jgi:hypothetical protein
MSLLIPSNERNAGMCVTTRGEQASENCSATRRFLWHTDVPIRERYITISDCQGHSFSPSLFHPLAHTFLHETIECFFSCLFSTFFSIDFTADECRITLPKQKALKKWEERKRDFRCKKKTGSTYDWTCTFKYITILTYVLSRGYLRTHTREGIHVHFVTVSPGGEEVEEELIILLSEYSFNPLEIFFSLRFVAWIDRPEKSLIF